MSTAAATGYRSAKLPQGVKAGWINKWYEFHEAFPSVRLETWCKQQNLSHATFGKWLRDPRLNKRLREALRQNPTPYLCTDKNRKKQGVTEVPGIAPPEPEKDQEMPADLFDAAEHEEPADTAPVHAVETTLPSEPVPTGHEPFVIFTSADFRIEVSKAIPVQDINRIIGFARSMMNREETSGRSKRSAAS